MTKAPFDPAAIRELAEILTETGLTEIEISDKDRSIRVARQPSPVMTTASVQAASVQAAPAAAPPAPALGAPDDAAHPGSVKSPMVGIAYLSAEPGSPTFVTPGQAVAAGQTLLLIEAMKTFNQIKAARAGTVLRVLVASGEAVEYGQVLMVVE